MSKDQGRLQQRAEGRGQRARLRPPKVSGRGDDRAGRKMGEPLAEHGWLKGPLKKALKSGWKSPVGLGHPVFPRLALARRTGFHCSPNHLPRSPPHLSSSCHLSRARLRKDTLTTRNTGSPLGYGVRGDLAGLGWGE